MERTLFFLKRQPPKEDGKYLIIPFKQKEVVIGRAQGISYTIADLAISRRHVIFRREEDSWTITNLSSNGVLLNGKLLPPHMEHPLPPSSTVQFCQTPKKFVYKFGSKVLRRGCKYDSLSVNSSRSATRVNEQTSCTEDSEELLSQDGAAAGSRCATTVMPEASIPSESTPSASIPSETISSSTIPSATPSIPPALQSIPPASPLIASASTSSSRRLSDSLLKQQHNELTELLHEHQLKYSRLQQEKRDLADSLMKEQHKLEQKYEEERQQLLRLVSDEQKKSALLEKEEALALQLQQQVGELESRLEADRLELEHVLAKEEQRKQQLQQEQETVRRQMQEEVQALQAALVQERSALQEKMQVEVQAALVQERGALQEQMQNEMAEKVQEMEQKMQEKMQQLEQCLQQEQKMATELSEELQAKREAALRLEALERDKSKLEQELEQARLEGSRLTELQASVQQMEQEKATLQQEMEMMEFAVTAEAKKSIVDTVEGVMDSEMQCPICNELFIKAILLSCSHTFCQFCIDCWKKTKRDCPSCRAPIKSETRSLAIDNFIDKIVLSLSEEMKRNRRDMIREREEAITAAAAKAQAAKEAREAARSSRGRRGRGGARGRGSQPPPPQQQERPLTDIIAIRTNTARSSNNHGTADRTHATAAVSLATNPVARMIRYLTGTAAASGATAAAALQMNAFGAASVWTAVNPALRLPTTTTTAAGTAAPARGTAAAALAGGPSSIASGRSTAELSDADVQAILALQEPGSTVMVDQATYRRLLEHRRTRGGTQAAQGRSMDTPEFRIARGGA